MELSGRSYDVFLSYHWRDHQQVEAVARALRDRGVAPFLDRWYLVPGRPWPQALESVFASCRAVAVFLGPHGTGSWQQRESYMALDRQTRDAAFGVIPVMLPGSAPALGFLSLNTWVDLRSGLDDVTTIELLVAAVRGQAPGPELRERALATLASVCPYKGLHAFREEDAAFFFGREAAVDRLAKVVEQKSLVALVGASGTGKSSVALAGLVPRVRRRLGGREWEVITLRPGDRPLHALAAAVAPLLEPEMTEADRLAEIGKIAGYFTTGDVRLRDVVTRVLEKQTGTDRLLLVADQWEELYTLCPDDGTRQRFVDELLDATATGALTVALTLRGDFYGHSVAYRALADRLQDAVVNLGPMNRDELEQVVEKPATKARLRFESGLVKRIVDDVKEEPGGLPLLEFVLTSLWDARRAGELLHEVYDDMKGIEGAIARRADEKYRLLSPAEQQLLRRVFLQLVRPGEGTDDTRRRAVLAEIDPRAREVVTRLTDARLLVTARDESTGEQTVEVAHEALIRKWYQLRGWVAEDREFLLWRQRLHRSLTDWERTGRHDSDLLHGAILTEAAKWELNRHDDLSAAERNIIVRSRRADRSQRARTRNTIAAVGAVVLALAVLAGVQGIRATREAKRVWTASIVNLASDSSDPLLSALLLSELMDQPEPPGGDRAARRAIGEIKVSALFAHDAGVTSVAFSPDGERLATAEALGTARIWRADGIGEPVILHGGVAGLSVAAFSPDGARLATTSSDGLRIWPADGRGEPVILRGHEDLVFSVAFRPDGNRLATGSSDRTARVWRTDGTGEPLILRGHEGSVLSVAFSPDGVRLATASEDGTARIWRTDGTGKPVILRGHEGLVWSVTFSPDGTRLATGSGDGTARIWRADGTGVPLILRGHEGGVWTASFSPDGALLATGSDDGTARIWRADGTGEPVILRGHLRGVRSVAFSPDGTRLATASDDWTARIWRIDAIREPVIFRGLGSRIRYMAFSQDGTRLATASDDGTARIRRTDGTGKPVILRGHEGWVFGMAFSPDGARLATGSEDHTARIWRTDGTGEPVILRGHENRVRSVAFSPDGARLATASDDGTARIWRSDGTGEPVILRGHERWVLSVVFSPAGGRLATGSVDSTVHIWRSDDPSEPVVLRGHEGGVLRVAFSPDGARLATASDDGTARIWRADGTGEPLILRGHEDWVLSLAFSPDGTRLATGSADYTARIWTVDGIAEPVILRGHEGVVDDVAFSADGARLATASSDGTARIWRAEGWGRLLIELRNSTTACLFAGQRESFLGESPSTARSSYEKCEQRYGRTPRE